MVANPLIDDELTLLMNRPTSNVQEESISSEYETHKEGEEEEIKPVDFKSTYKGFKQLDSRKISQKLYEENPDESKWGKIYSSIMVIDIDSHIFISEITLLQTIRVMKLTYRS